MHCELHRGLLYQSREVIFCVSERHVKKSVILTAKKSAIYRELWHRLSNVAISLRAHVIKGKEKNINYLKIKALNCFINCYHPIITVV